MSRSRSKCAPCCANREAQEATVNLDFTGFDIPNVFVVGYGLDFDERFDLPFLGERLETAKMSAGSMEPARLPRCFDPGDKGGGDQDLFFCGHGWGLGLA